MVSNEKYAYNSCFGNDKILFNQNIFTKFIKPYSLSLALWQRQNFLCIWIKQVENVSLPPGDKNRPTDVCEKTAYNIYIMGVKVNMIWELIEMTIAICIDIFMNQCKVLGTDFSHFLTVLFSLFNVICHIHEWYIEKFHVFQISIAILLELL